MRSWIGVVIASMFLVAAAEVAAAQPDATLTSGTKVRLRHEGKVLNGQFVSMDDQALTFVPRRRSESVALPLKDLS